MSPLPVLFIKENGRRKSNRKRRREGFRVFTNIAINKGNRIGVSDEICVPILSDIIIKEPKLKCVLQKSFHPIKGVIKARECWTEVKNVHIKILKDRIFLTGLAFQDKILVGEDNVSFCQRIIDELNITATVNGLTPGMIVKWHAANKEYTKIRNPHFIMYFNELTFDLQIIEQKTLWVKTRLHLIEHCGTD